MRRDILPAEYRRFPENWTVLPFTDAFKDKTGGQTKIQKGDYLDRGKLPIVDQGQSLIGGYTNEVESACNIKLPCVLFGDHTKIFKFIDTPFAIGADGVKVLSQRNDIYPKFAYYYFGTLNLPDVGYSRHFRFLKRTFFPLPPLEEQKRIAAILDKADAIRRKRKEAIRLTEELLRSTFLDMFGDPVTNPKGWEKMPLGELVPQKGQIVDGPFGSSLKPECYVADGVRVVRNFNIQDDFFDESEFVYVTEEKFSEIKRSNVQYGDLLLSTKGTIGNVCIMPKLEGKSVLSASGTVRIRFPKTSQISPEFAVQQMIQKNYKQYMKWFEAGTNQKYLNLSGIRKMELIVPPLELQQQFLNSRTKNYSLKSKNNSTFVETDNLFNSLLQKAFRGEL